MCLTRESRTGGERSVAVDWHDCAWSPLIVVQGRWGEATDEPARVCQNTTLAMARGDARPTRKIRRTIKRLPEATPILHPSLFISKSMKTTSLKSGDWPAFVSLRRGKQVTSNGGKSTGPKVSLSSQLSTFNRFRAFTIVELLVVIAIIGILAAMLLPVLTKAKIAAQKKQATIEMTQIVGAIQQYDSVYGRFPVSKEDQALAGTNDITVGGAAYDLNGTTLFWTMGITNNAEVVAILMDVTNYPGGGATPNMDHVKNPQRTIFLSPKLAPDTNSPGIGPDGVYRDPWGCPYIITMDLSYDDQCRDSNYCQKAVSQIQSGSPQGLNGLYNPDANPDSDDFLYHGKVMVWSAGPDRKIDAPPISTWGRADQGFNKDNILSWQ